jgi:hypothetical protein
MGHRVENLFTLCSLRYALCNYLRISSS